MFDNERFLAIVAYYRETRQIISPKEWEDVIARCFALDIVGGDKWMADVADAEKPLHNNVITVKTLKEGYPKTEGGKKCHITYCRDPEQNGLQTLADKCQASLEHFNGDVMTEVIVMHEQNSKNPDYYDVAVFIKPQPQWTSIQFSHIEETKEDTKFYVNGELFATLKKPTAKREQNCLNIHYRFFAKDAVLIESIYAPNYIPTTEEMIERYQLKNKLADAK